MTVQTALGNEAIALGLVEQGCRVVAAYPGTPSSEILAGVVKYKALLGRSVYTEWSVNEKVAFEVALAASWSGLRAAVAMKQVGLNVAADPLFSAAYTGVVGGFVVIPADDPGPHSSQTEQDSRLLALAAKVPVFDPSSPAAARAMVGHALDLSERFRLPVILRPTTRLCHAVQGLEVPVAGAAESPTAVATKPSAAAPTEPLAAASTDQLTQPPPDSTRFRKDPPRWAATPKFRFLLHQELAAKLVEIEAEFAASPLNYVVDEGSSSRVGLIASGVAFHTACQALAELGVRVPVLKIGTPYPLPRKRAARFLATVEQVLVLEEPDACIEIQLPERGRVRGRLDGTVPAAGELAPEVVFAVLADFLRGAGLEVAAPPDDAALAAVIGELPLPVRRPRLCPGCAHRSAFFTMKRTFGPGAIYPGDIGCYTLGTNLRAVDTFVDMGGAVTMANGFYQANRLVGDSRPIVASIGDSTFLHSGVAPLINAVHTGARFVLVILDNHTTAMTGFQPTPASSQLADGSAAASRISIAALVRSCGVGFVEVADPYDHETFGRILSQAQQHALAPDGSVAVVIADRPCILCEPELVRGQPLPVEVTDECDGCRFCTEAFECPALVLAADGSRVDIDRKLCVDCGQCIDACHKGFIVPLLEA